MVQNSIQFVSVNVLKRAAMSYFPPFVLIVKKKLNTMLPEVNASYIAFNFKFDSH